MKVRFEAEMEERESVAPAPRRKLAQGELGIRAQRPTRFKVKESSELARKAKGPRRVSEREEG